MVAAAMPAMVPAPALNELKIRQRLLFSYRLNARSASRPPYEHPMRPSCARLAFVLDDTCDGTLARLLKSR
jgi:hypothetical protein